MTYSPDMSYKEYVLAQYEEALDKYISIVREKLPENGRDKELEILTSAFMHPAVEKQKVVGLAITALMRLVDAEEVSRIPKQQP